MSLNHNYTCPTINSELERIEDEFKDSIRWVIDEISPRLSTDVRNEIINEQWLSYKNIFSDAFEIVRESNESLRTVAEEQIKELESEISDKDEKIEELEDNINHLNDYTNELEQQLSGD